MKYYNPFDAPNDYLQSTDSEAITRSAFELGTQLSKNGAFSSRPRDLVRGSAGHVRLLRVQLRSDLIERQSLYPRSDRPFVLVSGPAGAGKTTLVSQWLGSINRISTWLTLGAGDNRLSSFIRHLVSAIRLVEPTVGRSALAALRLPGQPPAEMFGNLLADDLHLVTRDFVLVIDDFDEANSDDILRFMIPLLRYPAPNVIIVLVSRSYPALPLARLRAAGKLEEIRAEQLRLTEGESRTILRRVIGQRISDEAVSDLLERCEGWAAGLHLAGVAIRESTDPDRVSDVIRLRGERNGLDSLFDEVFNLLPADVRAFLLKTSCVPTLNASLGDALLWEPDEQVDSASILKWLVSHHIYLTPLSVGDGWHRYNSVFRARLSQQLESSYGPETVHRLMTRARDWYDEHGFVDEAIEYSLSVDEPIMARDIVKRRAQTALVEGNWPMLESWLDALPSEIVERDPELTVLRAWCAWLRGRNSEARRFIAQATVQLTETTQPERNVEGLQAEVDCIEANLRWIFDEPIAQVRILERAFLNLPASHDFARAHALFRLGTARASSGRLDSAVQILHQFEKDPRSSTYVTQLALTALVWVYSFDGDMIKASTAADRLLRLLSDQASGPFATGWAHWMAGSVAYERNDLERAAKHLETAVSNREGIPFIAVQDSLFLLSSVYQRHGLIKEADALLDNLQSMAESINFSEALELARAYSALFSYQRGNLAVAYRWLDRVIQETPVTLPSFALPSQVIMARLLIERGSPGDLELASHVTFRIGRLYSSAIIPLKSSLHVFVLRGMIEERLGNRMMAEEFMSEAMSIVKPHGFVRTLIDLGPSAFPILQRMPPSYVRDELIAAFESEDRQLAMLTVATEQYDTVTSETVLPPSSGDRSQGPLMEALTRRELEVLKLLRKRLSNREIADALFISPQTVKRHNSNIFNKLGVSSRRQAISRSEEIGLLPVGDPETWADLS